MIELLSHSVTACAALACLLGCCVGSFINVIVYRLPIMRAHPERTNRFNLAWPSSSCPLCGHGIKPQHNLPVMSYLWLRGRSACCTKHINKRYVVIEIATGLLSVVVYLWLLNQHLDTYQLASVLLPSLLLVWWLVAITAMLWHSAESTQVLWQGLLWLGLIANLQRDTPLLTEAIPAVCAIYAVAVLTTRSANFMARTNASDAPQTSPSALDSSWHGLAALAAWFSWPGVVALSLGTAVAVVIAVVGWRAASKTDSAETKGGLGSIAIQHGIVVAFSVAWLLAFNPG